MKQDSLSKQITVRECFTSFITRQRKHHNLGMFPAFQRWRCSKQEPVILDIQLVCQISRDRH